MTSPIKISVKIGSKKVKVQSLTINQDVNDHHTFSIYTDSTEISNKDEVIKAEEIYDLIAKSIVVEIVNKNDDSEKLDFRGIVNSIDISKSRGDYDGLVISGRGKTIIIDDRAEVKTYAETTLADIAKEVLADFDGNINVNISPAININYCVQYNETPFDFISRLAFKYGAWFYYDGEHLNLGKYDEKNNYTLKLGKNMSGYDLSLQMLPVNTGYTHYNYLEDSAYEVLGGDVSPPNIGKYGEGTVDASFGYFTRKPLSVSKIFGLKESDVKDFVKNRVHSTTAQMIDLSGDSGNPSLGIGTSIEVSDQDGDSMGKYFVKSVTHSWNGEGRYRNHFEGIPAELKFPPPNPHVRIPRAGTQPAIITDNADPERIGRVRVRFPWQDQNSESPWIRMTMPYAGEGNIYFCPEIKDHVMVGFEHDNPDLPYVMGSLYHGKSDVQYFNEENVIKAIRTKSGHRIEFHEGEDDLISICTSDDKNQMILNMKDGEITVMTEGILNLKGKTINMEGEELNIKMDSAINIEAGQDTTIKSANINLTADQAASIKGTEAKIAGDSSAELTGAKVKVEGSAMAVLKGAMVQIN